MSFSGLVWSPLGRILDGVKEAEMKNLFESLSQDPAFRKAYAVEALAADAAELIARLMAEQRLTKAGLARKLNKSRAWVTQLLGGRANMTVRTLAEVTHALNSEVKLTCRRPAGSKPARTRRPA